MKKIEIRMTSSVCGLSLLVVWCYDGNLKLRTHHATVLVQDAGFYRSTYQSTYRLDCYSSCDAHWCHRVHVLCMHDTCVLLAKDQAQLVKRKLVKAMLKEAG